MKKMFDDFDKHPKDGKIDARELGNLFIHLGKFEWLTQPDLEAMIDEVDEDRDGQINFEEMQKMFHKHLRTKKVHEEDGATLMRLASASKSKKH